MLHDRSDVLVLVFRPAAPGIIAEIRFENRDNSAWILWIMGSSVDAPNRLATLLLS